MDYIKNIISLLRQFNRTTSHAPKDSNSTNQQSSSTMDQSANSPASHSLDPILTNNTAAEIVTEDDDEVAEIFKDGKVNEVIDLTTMDSDIITLDDSPPINEITQSSDEVPVIDLDEFYDLVGDLGDNSDDGTPETSNSLKEDEVITLDDIFNPIIESVLKDIDNENDNESQTENLMCDPAIESTFIASANDPITDSAFKAIANGPIIYSAFKASANDPIIDSAFEASTNDPIIDKAFKAITNGSIIDSAFKASVNDPIIDSAFKASVNDPIIDSAFKASVNDPIIDSAFIASVNDPIIDSAFIASANNPTIDNAFKASANDPIIDSACNTGEHEHVNESLAASTDYISDPTIKVPRVCIATQTDTVHSTKDDIVNVQENVFNNAEICCSQAPVNGFECQDFEESIQLFQIFQNNYEFPKSHQEEDITRYLVEIEKKSESESNNNENRKKKSEINTDILPDNKVVVKTKDLNNNAELEISQKAESLVCKFKIANNSTLATSNNETLQDSDTDSDSYHSSDFEFISEDEAKSQPGLYFNKNKLNKNTSLTPDTTSTSKEIPSTSNDSNLKQNYSLNVLLPTKTYSNVRKKREDCEVLPEKNNIETGNPLSSKIQAVPSTSNNIQHRDYKSLRLKFLADEEKRMRKEHKEPQGQEFYDLFRQPVAPMFAFENKSIKSVRPKAWCMDNNYEGLGFQACNMPQEEASGDDKKASEETTEKILAMNPMDNRLRRRRR